MLPTKKYYYKVTKYQTESRQTQAKIVKEVGVYRKDQSYTRYVDERGKWTTKRLPSRGTVVAIQD